jgi:hypothetical protein
VGPQSSVVPITAGCFWWHPTPMSNACAGWIDPIRIQYLVAWTARALPLPPNFRFLLAGIDAQVRPQRM